MSYVILSCVVEGKGEVEAVPALVRRIAATVEPSLRVEMRRPVRVPRTKLVKEGQLERYVDFATRALGGRGGVLVLLDADDDCPAELGPQLAARARVARPDASIAVVLAKREFEAWFLAGATSLRGARRLRDDLVAPDRPEQPRSAKEWLSARMVGDHSYRPTADQAALVARLDLDAARAASPSFDKCWREIARLLRS